MAPNRSHGGAPDLSEADVSFPLKRLFDPSNMDHIPENKRMGYFEHRNLAHIKHYKAAVKIFGGPLSRKRVIVAPPMETPMKHRLGEYINRRPPPPPIQMHTPLEPQCRQETGPPEEVVIARQAREREDSYKAWFKERQTFRNNLENMGLNIDWLEKKPSKTSLEKRVLRKLREDEAGMNVSADSASECTSITKEDSDDRIGVPTLKVPTPLGLKLLEEHLRQKKIRLIDLFTRTDKDKDWKLTRKEFYKALKEYDIPISGGIIEDMLIALDMNRDNKLNYQELAWGMDRWNKQRRIDRRKELLEREASNASSSTISPATPQELSISRSGNLIIREDFSDPALAKLASTKSLERMEMGARNSALSESTGLNSTNSKRSDLTPGGGVSAASDRTGDRSGTPQFLPLPDLDVRQEQLVLPTEEAQLDLRKRDKDSLKIYETKSYLAPGTILTGSKAVDNHCMKSTLEGEVGEMVDSFRQKRLQEYCDVCKLCEESGVLLSRPLLERVLLYPPDKPHKELQKIRHPDSAPLITSKFAETPKRPLTPIEVKHKNNKVRMSKSGKILIDSRHHYPLEVLVAPQATKQNLSTGRAVVRRRVNCWMTFEEYDRLTKHLAIRYQDLHDTSSDNAFWPGHLADKIRLCLPPYDKPAVMDRENSIYSRVRRTPAANYGYEDNSAWPVGQDGFVQVGIYDHYARKHVV